MRSRFEDDHALTMSDQVRGSDERFVTPGVDGFGRVLVIVYTSGGSESD